ncbi:MAG: divergent polysaccharide deacetylase family protein, partial [Deltaproteobacteria bacterium]|nr:divergent polysaccharide deacetylase family protein [Deltaproteobacteria bacterium]
MGYHHDVGKGMLALDLNLTFSFLPHAPFTKELE